MSDQSKKNSNNIYLDDQDKCLMIVNAILLSITLGNQMNFVTLHRAIREILYNIHSFVTNNMVALRESTQCPNLILLQSM